MIRPDAREYQHREFIHRLSGNYLHMQADQPYTDSICAIITAGTSAHFLHLLFGTLTFSSHLAEVFPVAPA